MTQQEARQRLAALGRVPDAGFDAIEAALSLAEADEPASPLLQARAAFQALCSAAQHLLDENPDAAAGNGGARARLIAALLASHFYAGDRETYDDPRNANLAEVLVRRRGLPVALGLIWIGLARQFRWGIGGVDFPGHFLLAIQDTTEDGRTVLLCDPFDSGRLLDLAALTALKSRITGADAVPQDIDLAPMSDRAVVLRLANNLRLRRINAKAWDAALTITEAMALLAPDASALLFAAGELALRVGRQRAAITHLRGFLETAPPPEQRSAAEVLLDKARQSLN